MPDSPPSLPSPIAVLTVTINRLMILILTAALFFLPYLVRWYYLFSHRSLETYPAILICLYVSAAPAYGILAALEILLRNIRRGEVFVALNVRLLRVISWCCLGVFVIFLIMGYSHLFSLLIAIGAAFIGLILRVLMHVFAMAVRIKQENDFTI